MIVVYTSDGTQIAGMTADAAQQYIAAHGGNIDIV